MDEFDWDEAKSEATLRTRGFDFHFASRVFDGSFFEAVDDRFDYGERRVRATGVVDGQVLTVVYTRRAATVRIISARPATRKERHAYRALFG